MAILDDLESFSKLQKTQRYIDILFQKVEDALEKGCNDPEYQQQQQQQLIEDCNALANDIEDEIVVIHDFIRDKYGLKFPELESLVPDPVDYARIVKRIGNEMDLTKVDLEGLLPSPVAMVVSITASTTSGEPLAEQALRETIEACDRVLSLDSAKKKLADFVETTRRIGSDASL
ncbi:U4/U6 small nuclear ribonucleoprotein Prp [Trema orientale]|uniref:U4/U6 small nuclear ribonucleoprotein Prp n=1 Tax=Trema orientale TaxID=63057 RepID=A0A2P5FVH3_TREOI|nr:U4/U6 small nuclear ribonucleoprotein Prp [Trema orientale]